MLFNSKTKECGAVFGIVLAVSACSPSGPGAGSEQATGDRQTAYRVRTDFNAMLNADSGWAAEVNQPARVQADHPFRLRVEVEHGDSAEPNRYGLQVRRNGGDWQPLGAENFPKPAKVLTLDFEDHPQDALREQWQWASGDRAVLEWAGESGDGYLRVEAGETPVLAPARYHTHWEPVEFAADVRIPEGQTGRAGLVFGYEDADNYQRVDVEPGKGLHVVQVRDGREETLATHEYDVQTGHWAELKVILRGPELTVEYDEENLVFTETLDSAVASPRVGVFAASGSALELPAIDIEGMPRTPRTSIIEAETFEHGDATRDLLEVSEEPFTGGAGISFADRTPEVDAVDSQTEWEFPMVIRRFAGGPSMNEAGDRFEYRVVNETGDALPGAEPMAITLEVPDGLLGGTFVETPMRIGPWQASNGDLYFSMEPAETDNVLMTVRSTDGGATWTEVDGANRPETGDLEGFASRMVDDRIHMLHQTSDHVFYHVFRTSDHPDKPDTWAIRDERLASPKEPPTQVADIAVRSDGSVVAVYGGPEKIRYRIRSPEGDWSEATVVDADQAPNLSGPALVKDPDDVVHLTYTGDDGSAWYRQLRPDGELTQRQQLATGLGTGHEDIGSILPPVHLPESDSVSVIYRLKDGHLWERRVGPEAGLSEPVQVTERPVVQNAVDAEQTGADAIGYGDSVHVLFIEAGTGHLYHTRRKADGDWSEPEAQVTDANVQWVRGNAVTSEEGEPVYGYVYDAGSDGGSGKNHYREVPLPAGD
ncbi:sialidase family protein [Vreelandella utahensis]|uniref:sialidase family protein n=1 Tax=Vreelandella halophila TaxID=86177 RepID=UPI00098435A5|nr:sialidase family protein [Halomonas utahensis]